MDVLSETYLKYSPKSIVSLIGKKGKNQQSMRDVPLEDIKEYAAEDADITLQLKEVFNPILDKAETKKLFEEIEIPLIPVLAAMELEGINLDVPFLKSMSVEMAVESKALEQKRVCASTYFGNDSNTNSSYTRHDGLWRFGRVCN